MTRATRKGFTLVELLVVITIIGMLVGLLVPAIVGARARARRTQCGNNQHELAVAVQQYENAQGHLPGYVNWFGSVTHPLSWPTVLLQYLGRNDLWEEWRGGNPTAVTVDALVCPADPSTGSAVLSYVANCGLDDLRPGAPTPPDNPANAVFLDRFNVTNPVGVMSERIPDGAAQTLLLSENVQAAQWNDVTEPEIGMVWVGYPDSDSDGVYETRSPDPPVSPNRWYRINEDIDAAASDIYHARPSSYHSGGVVVTYADGHQGFLDDDIDYLVFARIMAPNDAGAPLPP